MSTGKNYVGLVQEFTQKGGFQLPNYEDLGSSGPGHMKRFVCKVTMPGLDQDYTFEGHGAKKKEAKMAAAELLFKELERNPPAGGGRSFAAKRTSPAKMYHPQHGHGTPSASDEVDSMLAAIQTTPEPRGPSEMHQNFNAMMQPFTADIDQAKFSRKVATASGDGDDARTHMSLTIALADVLSARAPDDLIRFSKSNQVTCAFSRCHRTDSDGVSMAMCILFVSAGCKMARIVTHGTGHSDGDALPRERPQQAVRAAFHEALQAALHHMHVLNVTKSRRTTST